MLQPLTRSSSPMCILMQERREIERALLEGQLWGVAATNAMELGVDIGSLDVTLHLGFPGSIASLWQQVRQPCRLNLPAAWQRR
jgi:DEAD/DEAH box helicase domain-containing protein